MHIVHVFFAFPTGGAETMLVDIMNEQVRMNQVSLVIINNLYDKDLIGRLSAKISVTRIDRKPGSKNVLKIVLLNRALMRLRPDLIHCHDHSIIRYVRFVKCIKILTVHDVRFPIDNLNLYDKIAAISKAVKNDILSRRGPESEVIYNGIHIESIAVRNSSSVAPGIFRIVQIGRLDHMKKGQHILLQALNQIVKNNHTKIRVDFIGDGPSLDYLHRRTEDLGITDFVTFLGLRDRDYVYNHLRDYNLLVQPSLYEGFGLTVAEAMAARVSVLVSGIEGPLEIIGNGKYGHSFNLGDHADCAVQIEKIIMDYNSFWSGEITAAARLYVEQQFSIGETVKNYQALYNSLSKQQ